MSQIIDFSKYRKFVPQDMRDEIKNTNLRTAENRGRRCAKSDHGLGYKYQPEAWWWYAEFDQKRRQAFLKGYCVMWNELEKEKQA